MNNWVNVVSTQAWQEFGQNRDSSGTGLFELPPAASGRPSLNGQHRRPSSPTITPARMNKCGAKDPILSKGEKQLNAGLVPTVGIAFIHDHFSINKLDAVDEERANNAILCGEYATDGEIAYNDSVYEYFEWADEQRQEMADEYWALSQPSWQEFNWDNEVSAGGSAVSCSLYGDAEGYDGGLLVGADFWSDSQINELLYSPELSSFAGLAGYAGHQPLFDENGNLNEQPVGFGFQTPAGLFADNATSVVDNPTLMAANAPSFAQGVGHGFTGFGGLDAAENPATDKPPPAKSANDPEFGDDGVPPAPAVAQANPVYKPAAAAPALKFG